MLDFPGTPGTLTGFVLRILQCVFAAGSIASMATSVGFYNFTAFWYLFILFAPFSSFGMFSIDCISNRIFLKRSFFFF